MPKAIKTQNKNKYNRFLKKCLIFFFLSFFSIKSVFSMVDEEDSSPSSLPIRLSEIDDLPHGPEIELISLGAEREDQINSLLYSFIQKYLVQQERVPEHQSRKILRISAKGVCGLLGGLAGVPYFEVGREAGGGNGVIAWGIGLSNTVANSGIGSWSYLNLTNGLDPQSPEEYSLIQKSKLKLPAHLLSHTLGLIVAVPTGYMAAKYNTYKWLAIISYGLDYSLKTNGFLTFYTGMISQKRKITEQSLIREQEEREYSCLNMQQTLIQHLSQKTIPTLLSMREEERNEFITSLYHEDNLTVENYLNSLLNLPSPHISLRETPDTWKKGYPKTILVGGLSISPFINAIHNGYCAYAGWNSLYDNMFFTIPMATLSTIPIFALELKSTITTTRLLYDAAFYRISGHPQLSLEQVLYPKSTRVLPLICLSLAGITSYVGRFMVIDILEDILPREYSLFLSIAGFASPFIFASYVNYSLIKDCLLSYTQAYGEESKKKLVLLIQDIKKLMGIIQQAKPEEIKSFFETQNIENILSAVNDNDEEQEISEVEEANLEEQKPRCCGIM